MKRIALLCLGITLITGSTGWAATKSKKKMAAPAAMTQLKPGAYQATAKAIVCEGCGPLIEKTLKSSPGIEFVSLDQNTKQVRFNVKPNATVKIADLQKALKASSDEMGMGADYTLQNIQPAKKS